MAGASLPKRALSASATCPAGTIGICDTGAGGERGVISGDCGDGASIPRPSPTRLPALPGGPPPRE